MKDLTKSQQRKLMQAHKAAQKVALIIEQLSKESEEFRYDGNNTSLVNRSNLVSNTLTYMCKDFNFSNPVYCGKSPQTPTKSAQ